MTTAPTLTPTQADILAHTVRTGRYVTDEEPVIMGLVQGGLLRDHGPQEIAGGMHYYTLTSAGRDALNAWREAQPKRSNPKLTRSQARYREYRYSGCNIPFGEWLKWLARDTRRRKLGLSWREMTDREAELA